MLTICIIAAVICLICSISMFTQDWMKWRRIRTIRDMIGDFNIAYESCKELIHEQIEFCQSELGNDEGKFEISLSEEGDFYYEVANTKQMREYLNNSGNDILRYEDELIRMYGEMIYHDSYKAFRKAWEEVQNVMKKYGEE